MAESSFRVLSTELDETDGYIDVNISGLDASGSVELTDVDGESRTWMISVDRAKSLLADNKMIPQSEIAGHELWERVRKVGEDLSENRVETPFGREHAESALEELFAAAYEEER